MVRIFPIGKNNMRIYLKVYRIWLSLRLMSLAIEFYFSKSYQNEIV